MNLQRLEYFVAVIDAGSLSRAAAILDLSQPALSRQIALLEEETGHRLLTRHGRGVEPTETGLALLGHARGYVLGTNGQHDRRGPVLRGRARA